MSERAERLVTVLAFIAASVGLAFGGFDTLAAAALGTAGGYSMPRVPAPVALGAGLAAALAVGLSGCTPQHQAIVDTTCHAAERICAYVDATCDVAATSGGESE